MIQVINRAFDIIEFLSKDVNRAFTLSEIADSLDLNRATCANIIKTMINRNYLEQVGPKKGYKLGFMMYQAGGDGSIEEKLKKIAANEMEVLTNEIKETSLLAVLKGCERVIIHQVQSVSDLMVRAPLKNEAYYTPSGRLLVAMLDEPDLKEFLSKYGYPTKDRWPEAATKRKFESELEKIRTQGYATHLPPSQVFGIAYGIKQKGKTVASLSVYLPASRLTEVVQKKLIEKLHATARLISKKIS